MSRPLTAQELSLPLLPPPFLPFLLRHLLILFFPSFSFSSPFFPFFSSFPPPLFLFFSTPPPLFLPLGAFGATISLPSTTFLLKTSTLLRQCGNWGRGREEIWGRVLRFGMVIFPDTTPACISPGLRKQPLFLWPPPPVHQLRILMQRLMSSAFFPEQTQEPVRSLGVKGSRAGHGLGVACVQKRIQQREREVWERNTPLNETGMSWAVLELPGAASWQCQEPLTAPGTLGAPWKWVPLPS